MCPELKIKIPEQPHALNKFHRQPWKRLPNWFGSYFSTFQHKANHKFLKSFSLACFHKIIPGLHNDTNLQIRKLEVSLYDFRKYKGREKDIVIKWINVINYTVDFNLHCTIQGNTQFIFLCNLKNQTLHECALLSFK